jgi:hypothetical protein
MNKPASIRAAIVAALPELKRDPDRLQVYVDKGRVRATGAPGRSFEYSYNLTLILLDFTGDEDALMVVILGWLAANQADLLQNLETNKEAITFESDILDAGKVDLQLQLPLTERVIVKPRIGGGFDITHPAEPAADPGFGPWNDDVAEPPGLQELYVDGVLVAGAPSP